MIFLSHDNLNNANAAILQAQKGDVLVYAVNDWVGPLGPVFWSLHEAGLFSLTQKRRGPFRFEYRAERTGKEMSRAVLGRAMQRYGVGQTE